MLGGGRARGDPSIEVVEGREHGPDHDVSLADGSGGIIGWYPGRSRWSSSSWRAMPSPPCDVPAISQTRYRSVSGRRIGMQYWASTSELNTRTGTSRSSRILKNTWGAAT